MAPAFMSQLGETLRRRSFASFFSPSSNATDASSSGSSNGTASSGSSTPLSINHESDLADGVLLNETPGALNYVPVLPTRGANATKRLSIPGVPAPGIPSSDGKAGSRSPATPPAPYALRITNVLDGVRVCQKILLLRGTIGDPTVSRVDGVVTVSRSDGHFPPTKWPVTESHFKALVYLMPGPNRLRLEFSSHKPSGSPGAPPCPRRSFLDVFMVPATNTPPLHLAILVAKDSPETFDSAPARAEKEGNGIETAIQKFRMAAYLWQAFTAEQMARNDFGRRVFRFEEEWVTGTSNHEDTEAGAMRSEARVNVIRTDKTVAELRAMDRARRDMGVPVHESELFKVAAVAVREAFRPLAGQSHHVAVMLLDSHWDPDSKTALGHVAAGGCHGHLGLALFGSHLLQHYPGSFQELVPALTDCTPSEATPGFPAGDGDVTGARSWELANLGIGGHLQQVGRIFGCLPQSSGLTNTDYLVFGRTFVSREAYSARTKSKGGLVVRGDEANWHRLDCLRFLHHPCFRVPGQPAPRGDGGILAWPVEEGGLVLTAPTGISHIEIFRDDDPHCAFWEEFPSDRRGNSTKQLHLTEDKLREKLPEGARLGRLRLGAVSFGGGRLDVDDFARLTDAAESSLTLATGKAAFRSKAVGAGAENRRAEVQELLWESSTAPPPQQQQRKVLSGIRVFFSDAVTGIEFVYNDGTCQLLGRKGYADADGGEEVEEGIFDLDIGQGESVLGFVVWASSRITGLRVVTSLCGKSAIFGSPFGGDTYTMIPPRGFSVCGVAGSAGDRSLESFSVLVTRKEDSFPQDKGKDA